MGSEMEAEQKEQLKGFPHLQTLIFSATLTFTHHIPIKKGEKTTKSTNLQSADPKQKVSCVSPIYRSTHTIYSILIFVLLKVKKIAQSMSMRKGAARLAVVDLTPAQKLPSTLVECRMNCMDLLQKAINICTYSIKHRI
jgi:hypothetical protein